jgi:hypothetical protein
MDYSRFGRIVSCPVKILSKIATLWGSEFVVHDPVMLGQLFMTWRLRDLFARYECDMVEQRSPPGKKIYTS